MFSIWVSLLSFAFLFYTNFLVLFVVTRDPVPGRVLKTWRPTFSLKNVSTSKEYKSAFEETSLDNTDDETSFSSHHSIVRNKAEKDDVIGVQTGEFALCFEINGSNLATSPQTRTGTSFLNLWPKPTPPLVLILSRTHSTHL